MCILYFYVILKLILEVIHRHKQNKKFILKLILGVNFFVYKQLNQKAIT